MKRARGINRTWSKSWSCVDCGGWLDNRRPRHHGARCRICYQKHHQEKERIRLRKGGCATEKWVKIRLKSRPLYRTFTARKHRAKKRGIPWDINELDFYPLPAVCPVLGIPLIYNYGNGVKLTDNSASLDRINPKLGYIKGNVEIISARANRIKGSATPEELRIIADWIELKLGKESVAA